MVSLSMVFPFTDSDLNPFKLPSLKKKERNQRKKHYPYICYTVKTPYNTYTVKPPPSCYSHFLLVFKEKCSGFSQSLHLLPLLSPFPDNTEMMGMTSTTSTIHLEQIPITGFQMSCISVSPCQLKLA